MRTMIGALLVLAAVASWGEFPERLCGYMEFPYKSVDGQWYKVTPENRRRGRLFGALNIQNFQALYRGVPDANEEETLFVSEGPYTVRQTKPKCGDVPRGWICASSSSLRFNRKEERPGIRWTYAEYSSWEEEIWTERCPNCTGQQSNYCRNCRYSTRLAATRQLCQQNLRGSYPGIGEEAILCDYHNDNDHRCWLYIPDVRDDEEVYTVLNGDQELVCKLELYELQSEGTTWVNTDKWDFVGRSPASEYSWVGYTEGFYLPHYWRQENEGQCPTVLRIDD